MSSIVCSALSFSWPDDTPVFSGLSVTVPAGRTGLVAANGAGKSTLLKLIAGELRPAAGSVTVHGAFGYLPQDLPFTGTQSVAQLLGVDRTIAALHAIESGDAAEEHFSAVGSDWDVEERTRAELDRLGLGDVGLDRRLDTLSGGEIVSLGLVAQLLKQPDVLVLDEPTNNLDRAARARLAGVVRGWTGCLLVVSHDRELLEEMDRVAALDHGEIRWYGGPFSAYEEALRTEREAAAQQLRTAEQDLKRQKRELQQARERTQRRASTAARGLADAGLPRLFAGNMKNSAQVSAARTSDVHASRVAAAQARRDQADRAARQDDRIALELPGTRVPAGRTVFDGAGLIIRGPERIALTGANGAGKSTLLRLIERAAAPAAGRVAFLSQRLDLLDPDRTVAQCLTEAAPGRTDSERMTLLARFLFRGDRVHLPIRVLSGGERLRATLACVLFAEPAPQLLLLDEPTNNLDLVSVAQLESALVAYEGAFVVVSHDERFLSAIGVDRRLRLDAGRLTADERHAPE
ncbi:ABC-F family ATP-binding cassette domain-containing protein [Symbioplanes lichenis]|uniref:ABC-F family ATP-binding cassette domain-containing protein n=1 Tax=Symbioplanes lichenis TaxID=1629072 RepID=UPI0027387150|nr:ABC-F family ATP-binding cassette domain-containing protein [Actinoplanes lichenis]